MGTYGQKIQEAAAGGHAHSKGTGRMGKCLYILGEEI